MAWVNIPASKSLVDEFNAAFPGRDKASDGTIGDGEHSQTSSDHNPDETGRTPYEDNDDTNEVHARDVDDDLRKAGWSMQRVVDIILARCRSGAEKRIRYIIYNRRIISASWGWGSWHAYDGPSPHTEHAHFSFYYGSGNGVGNPENITSPWGFLAAVQKEEAAVSTQFSTDDRTILQTEATEGVLSYKDSGLPSEAVAGAANPNYLNYFTVMFNRVAELTEELAATKQSLTDARQQLTDLTGTCAHILAAVSPPPAGG